MVAKPYVGGSLLGVVFRSTWAERLCGQVNSCPQQLWEGERKGWKRRKEVFRKMGGWGENL